MSVISILLLIALVGFVAWAITNFIPMDPRFKNLVVVAAIVLVVLIVLSRTGVLGGLEDVRVGGAIDAPPYIVKTVVRY